MDLIERSTTGEHQIFAGEAASGPGGPTRHTIHSGQYFEVSPQDLIDVAKHISQPGESSEKTIKRAYELICECHLVSRNIDHWNAKVRRGHVSPAIDELVMSTLEEDTDDLRPINRKALLVAFEKMLGESVSAATASERFNEWLRDIVRKDDFLSAIDYSHRDGKINQERIQMLYANGWIEEINISGDVHVLVPIATRPTKVIEPDNSYSHPTEPYWNTCDVWWPEADPDRIEYLRKQIFDSTGANFVTGYRAKQELQQYHKWRDVQKVAKAASEPKKRRTRKDAETGQFAPKNPPQDPDSGKFRKKSQISPCTVKK
ncbi:hypothetical protein N9953_02220 [Akkermansiaceae bacterium]|nr:hypothetical protein [Akkermansiaceae bacterium]